MSNAFHASIEMFSPFILLVCIKVISLSNNGYHLSLIERGGTKSAITVALSVSSSSVDFIYVGLLPFGSCMFIIMTTL